MLISLIFLIFLRPNKILKNPNGNNRPSIFLMIGLYAATEMGQLFHYFDSEKAKRELGYQIGSVENALQDAWDWFQANGYV